MTVAQRPGYGGDSQRRAGSATLVLPLILALSILPFSLEARGDTATLTLGVASVSFPPADPDSTPQIGAMENPVSVTVKIRSATDAIIDLSVLAAGDLVSGGDSISISRVSWTAAGSGFVGGALSKTGPQAVGQWFGRNVDVQGSLWFWLANSWDYPSGTYSQTLILTLAAY